MIETAEIVAERYNISRETQERDALESNYAKPPGRLKARSTMKSFCSKPLAKGRQGHRENMTMAEGKSVTVGNAGQQSDGASVVV